MATYGTQGSGTPGFSPTAEERKAFIEMAAKETGKEEYKVAEVVDQYIKYLGRFPEKGGINYWTDYTNWPQVSTGIAQSEEGQAFKTQSTAAGTAYPAGQATSAEEYINTIADAMAPVPVPYDEAHPFAFDEALAREASQAEYDPYYTEKLNDYLTTQNIQRTRGAEDLATYKGDVQDKVNQYLADSGVAKRRLDEDTQAALTELQRQATKAGDDKTAYEAQEALNSGRVSEDLQTTLTRYGIKAERAAETYGYRMQQAQTAQQRITGGQTRELGRLGEETASWQTQEKKAYDEAVSAAKEGYSGRGILTSSIAGGGLQNLSEQRSQTQADYMRGVGYQTEDINRVAQQGLEDIATQIEQYGREHGWTLQDIEMAKTDAQEEASRWAQDSQTRLAEYGRQYEYGVGSLTEQQRLAQQAQQRGYETLSTEQQKALGQYQAGQPLENLGGSLGQQYQQTGTEYQRSQEDINRAQELYQRDLAAEQGAAVNAQIEKERAEQKRMWEAGRETYYSPYPSYAPAGIGGG